MVPMMSRKATRRRVLMGVGASTTIGVAGCLGGGSNTGGNGSGNGSAANGSSGNSSTSGGAQQAASEPLTADGSSTVYPITSNGASVWNSNPPADDEEYWGPGQYGFQTNKRMGDFFAGIYGFEGSGESQPPFSVNVGLSHSGTGIEKLMNGQVDIGDSSAPVQDELPERQNYQNFTDHVVGVDGQPVVVSKPIYDAGVTKLTGQQLRRIYRGEITNWSDISSYSGPGKEIQAICRAEGSGTDTAFRANLFGSPDAPIQCDSRIGQNQQVRTTVQQSDNAIAYMALAFVGGQAPAVALELDGTTYELGKNLGAKGYPLSRDLHCYTWKGTSKKEAAFINMLLTEYGQTQFVEANDYFKLPPERRQQQRSKLPDPDQQVNYGASGNSSGGGNVSSSGGNSSSATTTQSS
jgi:phosphate transport system substrate-binding protein